MSDLNQPQQPYNPQQPAPQQAVPQPAPQYIPVAVPAQKGTSGMGVTGLILGIIGVILSWIPIVNNVAFFIGLIGLVFGIFGIVFTRDNGKKIGRGIAIAGVVLSILAMVFTLATQKMYGDALNSVSKSLKSADSTSLIVETLHK